MFAERSADEDADAAETEGPAGDAMFGSNGCWGVRRSEFPPDARVTLTRDCGVGGVDESTLSFWGAASLSCTAMPELLVLVLELLYLCAERRVGGVSRGDSIRAR